mgnify:CR=1 FL=1
MRQFYVSQDSLGFMMTAYKTYNGSSELTDYWESDYLESWVHRKENPKEEKTGTIDDKLSPAQVTTP